MAFPRRHAQWRIGWVTHIPGSPLASLLSPISSAEWNKWEFYTIRLEDLRRYRAIGLNTFVWDPDELYLNFIKTGH